LRRLGKIIVTGHFVPSDASSSIWGPGRKSDIEFPEEKWNRYRKTKMRMGMKSSDRL
jgi:hypothetical protein